MKTLSWQQAINRMIRRSATLGEMRNVGTFILQAPLEEGFALLADTYETFATSIGLTRTEEDAKFVQRVVQHLKDKAGAV